MKAVIFHRSWVSAMSFMPEKDRADLMAAIMAYAFEEELPSSKNCSHLMLSVFCVIKDQIDAEVKAGKYKGYEYDEGEDE